MMHPTDGGPAFPTHGTMGELLHPGMTLRAYFAGQAMQALILARAAEINGNGAGCWPVGAEHTAWRIADAMILEGKI